MNMKKTYIILSLFLSLSVGQECDGLTEVELWGEWYNIESTTSISGVYPNLTGAIPPEIGCLTNLTYLNLNENGSHLTGEMFCERVSLGETITFIERFVKGRLPGL